MSTNSSNKDIIIALEKDSSNHPSTDKEIIDEKWFGFCSMQGYRPSMEDCHQHLIPLDDHSRWKNYSYFAIFDGHSGIGTARNASDYLHIHLLHQFNRMIMKKKEEQSPNKEKHKHKKLHPKQIRRAIKKAFIKLDKNLRKIDDDNSGSVCVACLISPKKVYLINVGDARAIIISVDGQVLLSTHDHKADDPDEQERIYQAGGHITKKSPKAILRVERRLAMTRVLGDFSLNKNLVPSLPDIFIYSRKLSSSSLYIIVACDGIWDIMSNEEVAHFVSERISTSAKLSEIASQLLDHCLEKKSHDNMSVYIIKLE